MATIRSVPAPASAVSISVTMPGEAIEHGETRAVGEQADRLRPRMQRHAAPAIATEVLDGPDERLPFRRRDLDGAEQRRAPFVVDRRAIVDRREPGRIEDDHSSGRNVRHVEETSRVVEREPGGHAAQHRHVTEEVSGGIDDADAAVHRHLHPVRIRTDVRADAREEGDAEAIAEDQIARSFPAHDVGRIAFRPAADDRRAGTGLDADLASGLEIDQRLVRRALIADDQERPAPTERHGPRIHPDRDHARPRVAAPSR